MPIIMQKDSGCMQGNTGGEGGGTGRGRGRDGGQFVKKRKWLVKRQTWVI